MERCRGEGDALSLAFGSNVRSHLYREFSQVERSVQNVLVRRELERTETRREGDQKAISLRVTKSSFIGEGFSTWANSSLFFSLLFPLALSLPTSSNPHRSRSRMSKPYKKRVIQADSDESEDEPLVSFDTSPSSLARSSLARPGFPSRACEMLTRRVSVMVRSSERNCPR